MSLKEPLRKIRHGFIIGPAGDPSGIATHAQAGAVSGFDRGGR